MNTVARPEGTFVISWAQTQINEIIAPPMTLSEIGATWIWRGGAVQIDGASAVSNPARQFEDARHQAAEMTRQIVSAALNINDAHANESIRDRGFVVSDGQRSWDLTMIDVPGMARPLLMSLGPMPPADIPLCIVETIAATAAPIKSKENAEGVVCFTPGTEIETINGPCAVESLVAGDLVLTRDAGAQPVVWVGSRNVSGARLYAFPDLRPVRIRQGALGQGHPTQDLKVSPDHRILVSGPSARNFWGEEEVLVAARDLIDGRGITRDMAAKSVTYYHLMLEHHHVILANGVAAESFHPAVASLEAIEDDQRLRLFDVMPELAYDPQAYGPVTRRFLTAQEAADLRSSAA